MDGGEDVFHHEALVEQDGVLVVVALPVHVADQDVLAEGDLTVGGGGAVGQHIARRDALVERHDRALVDAGALVGAGKLDELVVLDLAGVVADGDVVGVHTGNDAVALGQHAHAGVDRAFVLDAGGHNGGLGGHQRHGLALHVRTHQSAVRVVVLQEGDHGGRDGDHHLGADVDIVNVFPVDLDGIVAVTAGDTLADEYAVLVDRLGGLGDGELVLLIGGHIIDLIRHAAGALLDLAEGSHEEAVLIGAGVGGQIVDQTDVRAFGRLDRAQTAVMAVVHVSHVEARALAAQAAGAQSGDTALMRQLCEGVGLIHELAQRRGAEELLERRGDRADIDQALRGDDVEIREGHTLADDALHAAEADAELVLQQLAHAAHAAVAEMVDIVRLANAVRQAVEVVDGGKDVVRNDVLGDQDVDVLADGVLESLALKTLHQLAHVDPVHEFLDTHLGGVKVDKAADIHHAVGEHANDLAALQLEHHADDAGVGDLARLVAGDDGAGLGEDLAGEGVGHGLGQGEARDARVEGELLVELVAADVGQLVAAAVIEEAVEQGLGGLDRRRIARAQFAVDFDQSLFPAAGAVLLNGRDKALILAEDLLQALVRGGADIGIRHAAEPGGRLVLVEIAHGLQEPGDGQLAVLVDADVEDIVGVRLVLEPRAVIRDHRGGVDRDHGLIGGLVEIHAGRTHDLGDDDALRAVDDEGAARGHDREISHEDLLLLDLLGLLVAQTDAHLEGSGIRGVAGLALLLAVLRRIVHGVVDKAQFQIPGKVGHRVDVAEHLVEALSQKPLIGTLLDLQEVRHVQDLRGAGKALAQSFAVENIFWHWRTLLVCFETPGRVDRNFAPGVDFSDGSCYTVHDDSGGISPSQAHIASDFTIAVFICQELFL